MSELISDKGHVVGGEIIPKDGWQRQAYEQRGMRFYEPVAPAPRAERDEQGTLLLKPKANWKRRPEN